MKSLLFVLLTLAVLCDNSKCQSINAYFKVYDTKKKQEISMNDIAKAMANADVLFFGELHNDSIAHLLQGALLDSLIKDYKNITLSLEALSDDYQVILNEYLKGFLPESNFEKLANIWMPYYHSYKPLINMSKQCNLPVLAANVPDRYVSLVSERGMTILDSLDENAKLLLPSLPYYIPKGAYYEKFANSMKRHVYMNDYLFQSHCLYDATIAFNIFRFWKSHPADKIFQVIGNFHIDDFLGTIEQIHRLGNIKCLTISCFYDNSFTNPVWDKYKKLADFIIVTDPNVKRTF